MNETLEVRVMQSGFGGLSGTLYRIEPDGAFVARQIVAGEQAEVIKAGKMELGSMIALAETLRAAGLEKLPRESAAYTGINPSVIEVRYGAVARSLALPAGHVPGSGCEGVVKGAACRMLELSSLVAATVEIQE